MSIANAENILKLIYSYNPWWRSGKVPDEFFKPTKRFAFYEAIKLIQHPDIRRAVILSGARRVGKTTILYQIMDALIEQGVEPKNILYVSFDHPLLKFCKFDDILSIYENNISADSETYFFFDEIQYAENWEVWLKVLYDTKPSCKMAATGSASPVIAQGASESGVGRWSIIPVPTLSFYEYCELINAPERPELSSDIRPTGLASFPVHKQNDIINNLVPLQKHFYRYLTVGGFPELAMSKDEYYAQRMLREDVVDKVIKRDIPTLFNVRNAAVLEKIFLYLCYHSSGVISIETICKEVEMSRTTVENYIDFLSRANLIYISEPVDMAGKKVLKAKPKIYVSDAAIRNAVLMLDDVLTDPVEMGVMVETAVYKHMAAFYFREKMRVGYFRKTGGNDKEIDVVVEFPRGKILVEVKYRESPDISERDAIVESIDDKTMRAIIVTKNPTDFGTLSFETRVPIMKIPAHAFLYLLGHAEKCGYLRGK